MVDCHRLTPGWFRRLTAHAIAARAKASINRTLRPGDRGGTGGKGRDRGALTEGAVVVTVTVRLVAEFPGVTEFGESVQFVYGAGCVHAKLTLWLNPPWPRWKNRLLPPA
jgi:hypothetical protein